MRLIRVLLVIIAVVCIGVAVSYPIRYRLAQNENNSNMDELSAMRARVRDTDDAETDAPDVPVDNDDGDARAPEEDVAPGVPQRPARPTEGANPPTAAPDPDADAPVEAPASSAAPSEKGETGEAGAEAVQTARTPESQTAPSAPGEATEPDEDTAPDAPAAEPARDPAQATESRDVPAAEETAAAKDGGAPLEATPVPTPGPTPVAEPDLALLLLEDVPLPRANQAGFFGYEVTPSPEPTPVWDDYDGPLPYPMLDKVAFDESAMLPELREIYALNNDLVGWINIPGTVIDYPVVQCQNSDYYLEHDFYGNANINGQIILDTLCDPYTPSYNLIISGHHMKNGSMFGDLPEYRTQGYWEKHKLLEFDSLMFRKQYVVFAAFYSADYDEDEEGFRYNANIQYKMEAQQWLKEIEENRLYDTGIDVAFGDEFITLTTCNRARHRNGRFVVVCRRIREGETFE